MYNENVIAFFSLFLLKTDTYSQFDNKAKKGVHSKVIYFTHLKHSFML